MKAVQMIGKHFVKILFAVTVAGYIVYLAAGFVQNRQLISTASRFVDYFYSNYNSRNYSTLYGSSTFENCDKCTVDLERFKDILQLKMEKLGKAQSWKKTQARVTGRGRYAKVVLEFEVGHEKGEARERFRLAKHEGKLMIAEYNVFSEALIRR